MKTSSPKIIVYGAYWCPDCRRSKQFLGENQIPYQWVDIEQDKAGEAVVLEKNAGKRIIPTIVFEDGAFLVEPSNAELAEKLGLKTTASRSHYDLIIIGGGPAGLTAGLYTAREGIDTLVIERAAIGGQAAATQWLDNIPGFKEGVAGGEFAANLGAQAGRFGVEFLQAQDVSRVHIHNGYPCVCTNDGSEYSAKALLLATGSRYKRLGTPGENDFIGAGIHFCATCDGPFYKGQHVAVIGGGNSAVEESLHLVRFVDHVTLLVRGSELKASKVLIDNVVNHPQITIRYLTEVVQFSGEGGKLKTLTLRSKQTGETETFHPAAAFVFIGLQPNTGFLQDTGIVLDPWGFVVTGHDLAHAAADLTDFQGRTPLPLETSLPGIFAAGDLRKGATNQVASAAGEGAAAALMIREYLKLV